MSLTEEQWAALAKPFPPEAVNQKPKKDKYGNVTYLDYIGHAEVTERLNSVDPEWTWRPVAYAPDGGPLVRTSGEVLELWIELTVGGVTRPGVGTVNAAAWSGETAKELISDALRNSAMRFGVALDLWKKHDSEAPVNQAPQVNPGPQAQRSVPQPRVISDPNAEVKITEGQSKNAYRLYKKLEKEQGWTRDMYFDAILISTGSDTTDDRNLSKIDAGKLISYLKEQAGETDATAPAPTQHAAPPPDDSLFELSDSEPF